MRLPLLSVLVGVLLAAPLAAQRGPRGGGEFGPLKLGDPVPDVSAFDERGKEVSLRELLRDHYSVVVFGCLT